MSELSQHHPRTQLLRQLLLTASSAALLTCSALEAYAEEADHPTVWIEVGGAFDQLGASSTDWLPPNLTSPQTNPAPLPFGKLPTVGFDADLKLSIAPNNSDWTYSMSIRYGRAKFGPKHSHDQAYTAPNTPSAYFPSKYYLQNYDFANATQRSHASHAILDFMAGKDFGIGIFGHGKSTINFGVRIAQLNEHAVGQLTAFTNAPAKYSPNEVSHKAELIATHSFNGVGPSASWDASAPLVGSSSDGFSLDWGANAALLFGRQKANVSLQTKDTRYPPGSNYMNGVPIVLSHSTRLSARSRTIVVPNVGGFAGLSWHLPNAKVSLGYRADFFFGAVDRGLDARKSQTASFHGPFATIGIGLGG